MVHIARCLRLLLGRKPDIVYLSISQGTWGYLRDLGFLIPAALLRRRIVVHLRGSEFGGFYRGMPWPLKWVSRLLFQRVRVGIVLSSSLKGVFEGLIPGDRIEVVPNGIDCGRFAGLRREDSSKVTGKRILWLSNLFIRKGFMRFLESLPEVAASYPEATVTLAGDWESPEVREQAMRFVESHNLSSAVTFAGRVDGREKRRLFETHDVFVLTPIQAEGMPWSILEAMSAGLPVISSRQGAIPDLVINGKTGFLAEPNGPAIAACLKALLNEPDLCRFLGAAAREHVRRFFSQEAYLAGLIRAFQAAIR